jgi:hypothetical protein
MWYGRISGQASGDDHAALAHVDAALLQHFHFFHERLGGDSTTPLPM